MGVPWYIICHFSLVAFNILSVFSFCQFDYCLGVFLLGFILPGPLCAPWTWLTILSHVWEIFSYYLFRYFSQGPFSLPSPSGTPIMRMLVCLMSHRSLRLSSIFFHSFCGSDFHHSVLQVIYLFFCLSYSAIDSF